MTKTRPRQELDGQKWTLLITWGRKVCMYVFYFEKISSTPSRLYQVLICRWKYSIPLCVIVSICLFFLRGQRRRRGFPTWILFQSGPDWPDGANFMVCFTLPKKKESTSDGLDFVSICSFPVELLYQRRIADQRTRLT